MFGIPAETPYDVRFRLLGIPVRVSPWFWLMAAVLGWQGGEAIEVVIWIACVFVSILVHEYGHGLTARYLVHQQPSIVLHGMGGLCFYDREHRSPWGRVAVLAMGPGAGFLLAGLVAVVGGLAFGVVPTIGLDLSTNFLFTGRQPMMSARAHPYLFFAFFQMLYINIMWGLFNLLPIFPLDGGQLVASFLSMHDRREGQRRAFIVSFVTASLVALYCFRQGDQYRAFFVAYLALINFQYLQAATHQRRHGDSFDDDNWWRR